jgi:glyoxylase-like metal-dependent hydrolase (beta-lactamase superfamily II)
MSLPSVYASARTPLLGATPADLALRSLGIVRLVLPVPFAAAGGDVNVYLLDNADGSLTLFDTGLGGEPSLQLLEAGFAAAGRRVDEISRIVISHGHADHFGAARALRDRTRAPVHVHAADAPKLLVDADAKERRSEVARYLVRIGVPAEALERLRRRSPALLTDRVAEVEPLEEGQELELRALRVTVLHTPGHTRGHVSLHAPAARLLLSADHLLGHISPCPLIELAPGEQDKSFRALIAYLDSLGRIEPKEFDWVLPGHGEPFTDHRSRIARLRGFYARRQERLLAALDAGPRTPYELAVAEFGAGREDELFLILSEIVGNLEVLEQDGRVERIGASTCWSRTSG